MYAVFTPGLGVSGFKGKVPKALSDVPVAALRLLLETDVVTGKAAVPARDWIE